MILSQLKIISRRILSVISGVVCTIIWSSKWPWMSVSILGLSRLMSGLPSCLVGLPEGHNLVSRPWLLRDMVKCRPRAPVLANLTLISRGIPSWDPSIKDEEMSQMSHGTIRSFSLLSLCIVDLRHSSAWVPPLDFFHHWGCTEFQDVVGSFSKS
jgi:hypothetical protein